MVQFHRICAAWDPLSDISPLQDFSKRNIISGIPMIHRQILFVPQSVDLQFELAPNI